MPPVLSWVLARRPAWAAARGGYGPLNATGRNKVNLGRIVMHWPDMRGIAGCLVTSRVRAYGLLRMLTRDGGRTPLGAGDRRVRVHEPQLRPLRHPGNPAT